MDTRTFKLEVRWGVSRGRESYGYTTCSLKVDGIRRASCNGGGYDMRGTVIGRWIAEQFKAELNGLKVPMSRRNGEAIREYYGLSFHDPDYRTPEAVIENEKAGKSLGLERYQAYHSASSNVPTKKHTVPQIDGACGLSSVENILRAVGYRLRLVYENSKLDVYECQLIDDEKPQ